MTNPTPRPALRKADDATVHPAAPRPARRRAPAPTPAPLETAAADPAVTTATGAAATAADAAGSAGGATTAAKSGSKSGSASRAKSTTKPAGKSATKPAKDRAFRGSTSDHLRPSSAAPAAQARPKMKELAALLDGKPVDLDVRVPKNLRKAARSQAKKRGLDLDAVTTELLYGWITGER
jgi:hypothetical protein